MALVLLTAVTALGLAMADAAITGADRTPDERRVAAATAAHLVAPDGPLAERANVLNESAVAAFDGAGLRSLTQSGTAVAVRLDGRTVAATGEPADGTTIRRLVLVERPEAESLELNGTDVTLPRRADDVTVTLTPSVDTNVTTVRANDRVVLHNDSGLSGSFEIRVPRYETTVLRFQTAGRLGDGDVRVSYDAPRATKATLAVTVDA